MMPVAINRHRPQPTLADQVLKEPGHRLNERIRIAHPTLFDEPGDDNHQHLLNRHASPLRGPAFSLTHGRTPGHPVSHEPLDMTGQLRNRARAAGPRELPERDEHRHPVQHRPRRILALVQPRHVLLDLRSDPSRADPIDRLRLDEVALQHEGQPPVEKWMQEPSLNQRARVMCPKSPV
jgi:hypothetical protein